MLDFGGKVSYTPSILELALLDVEDPVERWFRVRQQFICISQEPVNYRGFRAYWAVHKRVPCTELFPENRMNVAERLQRPLRDVLRFNWRPRYLSLTVKLWDRDGVEIENPVVEITHLLGRGRTQSVDISLFEADELLAYAKKVLPRAFHGYLRK